MGVLSAPELPAQVAEQLVRQLPALLERRLGSSWLLILADEPQLGGETSLAEIADTAVAWREREQLDLVICLTDVPLRAGRRPLVAAASVPERIAIIALPAFGATRLRARVREAALALIAAIVEGDLEERPRRPLIRPRVGDLFAPVRSVTATDLRMPLQFVIPAGLGHLRLLSGMVRANRPWRAMRGLSYAVVAALATGAYEMFNSVVWTLSDSLSPLRLVAVMVVAILAIVIFLIVSHGLWQRPVGSQRPKEAALYNGATALTLLTAVACAYLILFVGLLAGAALVVDAHSLGTQIGRSAGAVDYARLAWLGASIATVAGALGSGLESIEEVREAAYGHNQRRREG